MPKNQHHSPMTIVTENPLDTLWEQLSCFESGVLAKQLIERRAYQSSLTLDKERLESKANALAHCIRNAREYMRLPTASMTATATANYYGCLWLASAVGVANPLTTADLPSIEKVTKKGHGLGNVTDDPGKFPNNEYIFVKPAGFFREFLKWSDFPDQQVNEILCFPEQMEGSFRAKWNENSSVNGRAIPAQMDG